MNKSSFLPLAPLLAAMYSYAFSFIAPSYWEYRNAQSGAEIFLVKELCIGFAIPLLFAALGILISVPAILERQSMSPARRKIHIITVVLCYSITLCYLLQDYITALLLASLSVFLWIIFGIVGIARTHRI